MFHQLGKNSDSTPPPPSPLARPRVKMVRIEGGGRRNRFMEHISWKTTVHVHSKPFASDVALDHCPNRFLKSAIQ